MAGSVELEPISGRDRITALDAAIGVTASAIGVAALVGRRVVTITGPIAGVVLRPPVVPARHQPGTWLLHAARRGAERRSWLEVELRALLDVLVPAIAQALLRRMDLTDVVRRHVDLDELVATVDLDGVAARLDLDAVVGRLDLDRIVRERVDLDGLVATVDIDAIAARIDIEAVIARIDLVGLAEDVIAEVDLPEIIRESTGSMASETVRGVRMQGITADEALGRAVDRFRLRRSRRRPLDPPPAVVP
ncbi:hypothetical protein [Nocardioides sp. URHA0020]|uniref:hypothetical protein n=1 Tax=Nocardioides sp. URHA0020 TaxID=1380392 RepID=UPI000685C211|nr:hypothetical protein [Nocardioides sp. URHA0020]